MVTNAPSSLEHLNQTNLGDKALSKEEISYIQSKDQLWFKDIGDKLFGDIVAANENLLKNNAALKGFIDDIILQPETMRQIANKSGLALNSVEKIFSGANQGLENKQQKYLILVNLLLYGCTKTMFPEVSQNLINNINKPAFTGATAKALHRFQKMGEKTMGWSKADCLLGPKTIQQMLSYLGVQTVNAKVDAMTFAKSNISAKNKYEWNSDQQKQMDAIVEDPMLSAEEKVITLAKVAQNTVDVGGDKLNKKYGAVSYMCQLIANKLIIGLSPDKKESVIQTLVPYTHMIKKYWNEQSAVTYGVDPTLVPKTNDFVADIKKMATSIESKYESNAIMVNTAMVVCNAWISYYQQDNPTGWKKNKSSIEIGMKELYDLQKSKTSGDIRQKIASSLDKIFFDTATKFDFSTVITDKVIVGGIDIAGSFTTYENLQKRAFTGVKNIFLANKRRDATESKNAINEILTAFRYIDQEMDGDFDVGIGEKFRIGTWKTSDGIKSTVENIGMSSLSLDIKNAPKAFTDEQNAIKKGVQNIKNALETDPNGKVAQKVDTLLDAIAQNNTTTIRTLIKDAALFGVDVSDKSIGEITKRMQEISKQNENNKTTVLNDMKNNYSKMYDQMTGTIIWLKEQGRNEEADTIERNKSVFENLIKGGVVTNPPEGLEQFAGKTLNMIATEEIHKMERMQLTGVLEVGLMRGLMMKYENMLKSLAEKSGLSADENLIKMYADIEGFDGSWTDETCNTVGAIVAEILITIAVCILTAGVGGVLLNAGLKAAQYTFKAVRLGAAANKIARFGQLGNTSLKVVRSATGVTKTIKAGQVASKIAYRSSALLVEAPVFNSVSKIIHNGIAGSPLLEGVLGSYTDANGVRHEATLNPIAKENIKTAAFLGVMHGFSVLRSGVVKIDFGKAGEVFAKSPTFVKGAGNMAGEFTTMMASEQVINLTFGREIQDPANPGKNIIERGIHIPDKQEMAQMVGMILGMRATAKFNLWPKIEARLKTGEFTIVGLEKTNTGNIKDIEVVTTTGEKMKLFADQAKVKSAIEMKKANAEQRKVDKEANGGKESQEQKNKNVVVRMKTRNAPNKVGTRLGKEHKLVGNNSKNKAENSVVASEKNAPNPLLEIKNNMKAAMEYIGLSKNNVVTIEGKKHIFIGVKDGKALFVEKGVKGALPKEFSTVESMKDINFEPGSKETNAGRKEKFDALMNAKEAPVVPTNEKVETVNRRELIDQQFNNFDKSPSQKKLDSWNKRYEKQDAFELQVLQAQELLRSVDAKLLTEPMKKLMNAGDISQLSPNDVKRVQKEVGITPKEADGIWGPKSQVKLEAYFVKKGVEKSSNVQPEVSKEMDKVVEGITSKDPYDIAAQGIVEGIYKKNPSKFEEWVAAKTKGFLEMKATYKEAMQTKIEGYKKAVKDYVVGLYMRVMIARGPVAIEGVKKDIQVVEEQVAELKKEKGVTEGEFVREVEGVLAGAKAQLEKKSEVQPEVSKEMDKVVEGITSKDPYDVAAQGVVEGIYKMNPSKFEEWVAAKTKGFLEMKAQYKEAMQTRIEGYKKAVKDYVVGLYMRVMIARGPVAIEGVKKDIQVVEEQVAELKKEKGATEGEFVREVEGVLAGANEHLQKKSEVQPEVSKEMNLDVLNTKFNLSRNSPKSKKNIDKTSVTEEIPGLGTYEYSKRNNRVRLTLKTKHGTMEAEAHDLTSNEFILHADIGNNRLVAGKAYKFIFDKLPEGAKIIEKNNLSGDSYTNLLKIYKKGNTNEYKIYAGGYIELNLQGKNSQLSKVIAKNRIQEDGTISAHFETEIAAQNVVNEILKSSSELGLPEPRIVKREDGSFIVEISNIVIEKTSGLKSKNEKLNNNPVLEVELNKKLDEQIQSKDPYDVAAQGVVEGIYKKNPSKFEEWVAAKTKGFLEMKAQYKEAMQTRIEGYKKAVKDYVVGLYMRVMIARGPVAIEGVKKDIQVVEEQVAELKKEKGAIEGEFVREVEGVLAGAKEYLAQPKLAEQSYKELATEIGTAQSINDVFVILDKKSFENITFSDITLTGQQLKDRIMQYQSGILDISYIPQELRDKIISLPTVSQPTEKIGQ